jgi:hypothetical protein
LSTPIEYAQRQTDPERTELQAVASRRVPDYRAFTPAPADVRLKDQGRTAAPAERGPFGRWLLEQKDRDGFIGQLAQAARRDPAFPKDGDPEAVRKRMGLLGADPDMFEALEDAEMDWASY